MEKSKAESRGQTFTRSLFCKGKTRRDVPKCGDLLRNDFSLSGFIDDEEDKKNYFMDSCEHDVLNQRDSEDILGEDEDDFEFDDPTSDSTTAGYLDRVNKDFDSRKSYEELVLRILNYYQRSPQKPPSDASEFQSRFAKAKNDKRRRSLFLDLDDLLISVSMFQHPSRSGTTIDIKDASGKII